MRYYLVGILAVFLILELTYVSEAGLLTQIGANTELLGKKIHEGTKIAENKLTGLFHGNKDEGDQPVNVSNLLEQAGGQGNSSERESIVGAPRCGNQEVFVAGSCRPSEN